MKTFLSTFFMIFLLTQSLADTYTIDKRKYANWSDPEFQKIVLITDKRSNTVCTGEYVAKNIILTAAHCVSENGRSRYATAVQNYKNDYFYTRLITVDNDYELNNTDWALLLVPDKEYFSDSFFNVIPESHTGEVKQAGFGGLKILSDKEIHDIRKKFITYLKLNKKDIRKVNKNNYDKELEIINKNKYNSDLIAELIEFLKNDASKPKSEGGLEIQGLFSDEKLKYNEKCLIFDVNNLEISHNCVVYKGDSGSPLWKNNDLIGIDTKGILGSHILGVESVLETGISTKQFYNILQNAIKDNPLK